MNRSIKTLKDNINNNNNRYKIMIIIITFKHNITKYILNKHILYHNKQ